MLIVSDKIEIEDLWLLWEGFGVGVEFEFGFDLFSGLVVGIGVVIKKKYSRW